MKTTHCTNCSIKLRSKSHPAYMYPGTRERHGNLCKRCRYGTPEAQAKYEIINCVTCERPTRDYRDTANAGVLVRNGKKCITCARDRDIPDSDVHHMRSGLDSWLESRRKRLGANA